MECLKCSCSYKLSLPHKHPAVWSSARKSSHTSTIYAAAVRRRHHSIAKHVLQASKPDVGGAIQEFNFMMSELRQDPILSKILDQPRVQAALSEIQRNKAAVSKYKGDRDVMMVLERLIEKGMSSEDKEKFSSAHTSPAQLLATAFSKQQLSELLAKPHVQQALHAIRANPSGAAKYMEDSDVSKALDLLQDVMGLS